MSKLLKLRFLLLFLVSFYVWAQPSDEFQLQSGTVVKLIDGDRAKELLMTADDHTAMFSRFDIQSKTKDPNSAIVDDYMKYAAAQVKAWSDEEKKVMAEVVASVSGKISALGLNIKMPEKIEVIKSTLMEEGGAEGYTRSNYIVLKDVNVGAPSDALEDLFIHELFHVLSRYDSNMKERVYNSIGFKKSNEVLYPPEIADLRITNPDAPNNNYYITVEHDGKPVDVMLILYSSGLYKGGSFFTYLQIGMLQVEGDSNNKTVVYKDGKPVILKLKEIKNFFEQVGKNTGYIIHAEELSADHFVMLLDQKKNLPNPQLIEAMKNVMK
jgi:inorganic pyrophosphatase